MPSSWVIIFWINSWINIYPFIQQKDGQPEVSTLCRPHWDSEGLGYVGGKKYVPKLLLSEAFEHFLLQWVLNIFDKETGLLEISHPQGMCQKSRVA